MALEFSDATLPIPEPASAALSEAWSWIGKPGTWLTGAQRVAIVAEARHAASCVACGELRVAISPYQKKYEHDSLGTLDAPTVDVVHRLTNDHGRLTPTWFGGILAQSLSEGAYVETVSIVAHARAVDTFHRGLGLNLPSLPDVVEGEPSHEEPEIASKRFSWVRTVPPREATGKLAKFWFPDGEGRYVARVHQALSLVPDEAISYIRLAGVIYLEGEEFFDYTAVRGLERSQIEIVAARTSAMNECFY